MVRVCREAGTSIDPDMVVKLEPRRGIRAGVALTGRQPRGRKMSLVRSTPCEGPRTREQNRPDRACCGPRLATGEAFPAKLGHFAAGAAGNEWRPAWSDRQLLSRAIQACASRRGWGVSTGQAGTPRRGKGRPRRRGRIPTGTRRRADRGDKGTERGGADGDRTHLSWTCASVAARTKRGGADGDRTHSPWPHRGEAPTVRRPGLWLPEGGAHGDGPYRARAPGPAHVCEPGGSTTGAWRRCRTRCLPGPPASPTGTRLRRRRGDGSRPG